MKTEQNSLHALNVAMKEKQERMKSILDSIGDDAPNAQQLDEMRGINRDLEELGEKIKIANERDGYRKNAEDFLREFNKPANMLPQNERDLHAQEGKAQEDRDQRAKTAREAFREMARNEDFQNWIKSGARGMSPRMKTTVTGASSTSAGAFILNDRKPIVDEGANRNNLALSSLVNIDETNSDVVEFVRENVFTNASAETAEGGNAGESAITYAIVQNNVQSITAFLPITRRAMEDVAQAEGIFDRLMTYGIRARVNSQMFAGDGVSPNLQGLATLSGIGTQAWSTNLVETLRKARTTVRTGGKARATGYVLAPADVETLDLTPDASGQYVFGATITALGINTVWGVPIVEDDDCPAGTGYVGQWDLATLWVRKDVEIYVTDSHASNFVAGILTMLAEMRGAFGVIRPSAFVTITTTGA